MGLRQEQDMIVPAILKLGYCVKIIERRNLNRSGGMRKQHNFLRDVFSVRGSAGPVLTAVAKSADKTPDTRHDMYFDT